MISVILSHLASASQAKYHYELFINMIKAVHKYLEAFAFFLQPINSPHYCRQGCSF